MENIQLKMKDLFSNSCLAYCYAYIAGVRGIKDLTMAMLKGWYKGYIDDDGFVSSPVKYLNMLGLPCRDIRKDKYKELPTPQVVCYKYNGNTHFVVMQFNKVIFDPSGDSFSVKYGKIDSTRIVVA